MSGTTTLIYCTNKEFTAPVKGSFPERTSGYVFRSDFSHVLQDENGKWYEHRGSHFHWDDVGETVDEVLRAVHQWIDGQRGCVMRFEAVCEPVASVVWPENVETGQDGEGLLFQ